MAHVQARHVHEMLPDVDMDAGWLRRERATIWLRLPFCKVNKRHMQTSHYSAISPEIVGHTRRVGVGVDAHVGAGVDVHVGGSAGCGDGVGVGGGDSISEVTPPSLDQYIYIGPFGSR